MDKSWISSNTTSMEYIDGVLKFLEFASATSHDDKIACPCISCANQRHYTKNDVFDHLLTNRFSPNYTCWYFHGESLTESMMSNQPEYSQSTTDRSVTDSHIHVRELLEDMITGHAHIGDGGISRESGVQFDFSQDTDIQPNEDWNDEALKFYGLLKETNEELFKRCKKHSKLSFALDLFHTKCLNGWSNKSFNKLLETLKETLPEDAKLLKSSYQVKKLIGELGLGYEKIHVCPNFCMLFWKDKVNDQECFICGASRWEKNKKPKKVLRWFPLKPRLQRIFMCSKTAPMMRWHVDERKDDGYLRHPADARAWKEFDTRYKDFANDPRNVHLGLASDGFNPFRTMSIAHSTWPVVLAIYNFPPWMCMKPSSLILSLLISGPESPGDKIDVLLQPLIEELNDLWVNGVETYDAHAKEKFQLHAALMWTINDFPAYGMLSGWRTKSKYACPSCGFDTISKWLNKGGKYCFMGHRRFLHSDHPFRHDKRNFDGKEERRTTPIPVTGSIAWAQLNDEVTAVNSIGEIVSKNEAWKRRSIFFDLPYWEFNLVRHNLDVMHIEKNVCDNILNTLLNVDGKTKDNLKSRLDLMELGIRKDLHPKELANGKWLLPPACYAMSTKEKDLALGVLKNVKVPDSYSSNISRCVKLRQRKLIGLKSHDCHVLIQDLLPIAIKGSLPIRVSRAIAGLCSYFHEICSKVLTVSRLEELESQIGEIVSCLETIFPPSFFTIMVHLVVHLATDAKLAGPVQYRWMYPIERYLLTLKQYVKNRAYPEGSIAEGYIANESITHCSRYFEGMETKFNRSIRNDDEDVEPLKVQDAPLHIIPGRILSKAQDIKLEDQTLMQAHRYVLYNCDSVASFINEHREIVKWKYRNQSRKRARDHVDIETIHHLEFCEWFPAQVSRLKEFDSPRVTKHIDWLAQGACNTARRFKGYSVKGARYHTKEREKKRKTQNSGVMVIAKTSSSDNVVYYGILNDIIELNYYDRFRVVLFKCDWVDVEQGNGLEKDELGFDRVNLERLVHTGVHQRDEPFVLASQVQQFFYVTDPLKPGWHIVVRTKPRDIYDMGDELPFEAYEENHLNGDDIIEESEKELNWGRNDVDGMTVEEHIEDNANKEANSDDEE